MAYFECTIGGSGAGATITVTYTSTFYNKTMTCTNGTKTYTKTTTSSGSTTFNVSEEGTWTITCNGVSRTVNVVLSYSTQMAITKTITVYGAVGATISFTDTTGSKTVTLNSSGQGSVAITYIPNQSITFTDTNVAKNPNNLSRNYSKAITLTSSTTAIYVMPNGALYWYGWNNPNMPLACYAISNINSGLKEPIVYEDATNYRGVAGQNGRGIYACNKKISGYTKLKIYSKQVYKADSSAATGMTLMTTTNFATPLTIAGYESLVSTNAGIYHENEIVTLNDTIDNKYVMIHIVDNGNTSSHTNVLFYALWLE